MKVVARKRRILIVGEGKETEYNYFVGFRNAFANELAAAATSISVKRGRGGDARGIVNDAIHEAELFDPDRASGDRVFLLLDAEGPGKEPGMGRAAELPAAEKLASNNDIEIVYSCPSFEYWLLCHFLKIPRRQFADCDSVIAELNKDARWKKISKNGYEKSDPDIFKRVSDLLEIARDQALEIDLFHLKSAKSARAINPSSQVYELIAKLIGAKTGKKCPLEHTWTLRTVSATTCDLKKGQPMPRHNDGEVHWHLSETPETPGDTHPSRTSG